MDAVKLLTIDCWREVLKRVKNPKDLKACSETCLLFQALLWRKKNAFLFELIFPKILQYLPETMQEPREGDGNFELERPISRKPALYHCRAVCKDWAKSVDKFAETSPAGYLFEYWFRDGGTTENFLNIFSTHVGNPFVGRRVGIEHRSAVLMAPPQGFHQNEGVPHNEVFHIAKIRQLLNRFGKEIWAMELFESEDNVHLALCKNIPTVLSQLPNLRQLTLNKSFMVFEEGNMDELPAYIATNPLPSLPSLECVDMPRLNPVMVRAILEKYASQLKYLTTCWDPTFYPDEFSRFSCLKDLSLKRLDANVALQGFRQLHSPLEILDLDVEWDGNEPTVWPIDELFRSIQHLPIRKLILALPTSGVFSGETAPMIPELRHESIEGVYIESATGTTSLNFLMYCPNLCKFTISYHRYPLPGPILGHPNGIAELLDVNTLIKEDGYDLYQSNIWELIPILELFNMLDFSAFSEHRWPRIKHTRAKYEERKREN